MKFIATVTAATLAFAASASAATCTPGLDYCSNVLLDVGEIILPEPTGLLHDTHGNLNQDSSNGDAIRQTLENSGGGNYANDRSSWSGLIFHCNNDHSLTWRSCGEGALCLNQGAGNNDICYVYPVW
ncbi:hypothetical protein CBS147346_3669 [Aspergillus niger]|nr:hypothetical protein CBS147346_3669 [Aspergillus niger]